MLEYRRKVPASLRPVLGWELKQSFGTKDVASVALAWSAVHAQFERAIADAAGLPERRAYHDRLALTGFNNPLRMVPFEHRHEAQEMFAKWTGTTPVPANEVPAPVPVMRKGTKPLFSKVAQEYYSWKPSAKKSVDMVLGQIRNRFGDRPVDEITLEHVKAYRDGLRGKIANNAIRRYMGSLGAIMRWAKVNYQLPANPFEGMRPEAEPTTREGFSIDELNAIFHDEKPAPTARYWVKPLALFTGARLEELGQLLVSDVRYDPSGVMYLDVVERDDKGAKVKNLKNATSKRRIPVHAKLIELGLLHFVERQKKARQRHLFPELRPDAQDRRTGQLSQEVNEDIDAAGVDHPDKVFH
ncbi:MAG TPA: hypothetical protein VEA16_08875, partial [Vicinamibacterales bacterium]|nr:hypothetical protein [Vicinamibacterales bacterium]